MAQEVLPVMLPPRASSPFLLSAGLVLSPGRRVPSSPVLYAQQDPLPAVNPQAARTPLSPVTNHHGSGAVIKHPIRSEPFPSAPSLPAYSLLLSLFLVESFSYKWYLCNLARPF